MFKRIICFFKGHIWKHYKYDPGDNSEDIAISGIMEYDYCLRCNLTSI